MGSSKVKKKISGMKCRTCGVVDAMASPPSIYCEGCNYKLTTKYHEEISEPGGGDRDN